MLHEFHRQSKLESKSCHATYILSGLIEEATSPVRNDAMHIEGDEFLMSSPPVATQESSRSNDAGSRMVRTVLLANEKDVHGKITFGQT